MILQHRLFKNKLHVGLKSVSATEEANANHALYAMYPSDLWRGHAQRLVAVGKTSPLQDLRMTGSVQANVSPKTTLQRIGGSHSRIALVNVASEKNHLTFDLNKAARKDAWSKHFRHLNSGRLARYNKSVASFRRARIFRPCSPWNSQLRNALAPALRAQTPLICVATAASLGRYFC